MKRISRSKSLKQKIVATKMKSYISVLDRRMMPIVRTTWRTASKKLPGGVTAEEKDKIWEHVQEESLTSILDEDDEYDRCELWVAARVTEEDKLIWQYFAFGEDRPACRKRLCVLLVCFGELGAFLW